MEIFFGVFAAGCGIYCLYGYYMVRVKKEITKTILLPKDVDASKCRDIEGYCKEAQLPLLILGIVTTLYGIVDLYNAYAGGADKLFVVMLVLLFAALVAFVILVNRCNKKYFEM